MNGIYSKIFKLIDQSNAPLIHLNGKFFKHFSAEAAEQELIELGIYNADGELITEDEVILEYYESHWC